MKYHFIHALVLTQFESSLTPLDWDTLVTQDYPIHALYCAESNSLLVYSDNQKIDCMNKITEIQNLLTTLGNSVSCDNKIIILSDDENEYNAEDVLKHFNA